MKLLKLVPAAVLTLGLLSLSACEPADQPRQEPGTQPAPQQQPAPPDRERDIERQRELERQREMERTPPPPQQQPEPPPDRSLAPQQDGPVVG
jgi:hypothetical protein